MISESNADEPGKVIRLMSRELLKWLMSRELMKWLMGQELMKWLMSLVLLKWLMSRATEVAGEIHLGPEIQSELWEPQALNPVRVWCCV